MSGKKTDLGRAAWPWIRRAVCALGLFTLMADGGLRQDELECEEAVAYLQGCCPEWPAGSVQCVHQTSFCDGTTNPDLSVEESQCVLATSCEEIVAAGICPGKSNRSVAAAIVESPLGCP